MKIFIGADHAGFKLKEKLKVFLKKHEYKVQDEGNLINDKNDDYPDFAFNVAEEVAKGGKGILICGSAEGVCVAANKVKGIRAVPIWTVKNARLSRQHNDANILCLSGWDLGYWKAKRIVKVWLETKFTKEKRHVRRLKKIQKYENSSSN